jgi:hypothetical protein
MLASFSVLGQKVKAKIVETLPLTTTERNALTPSADNVDVIFNETTSRFEQNVKNTGWGPLLGPVDVFRPITEGGNTGFGTRYRAENPTLYADIGVNAVDLSYSDVAGTLYGATGTAAYTSGYLVSATGAAATASGTLSVASGISGSAYGDRSTALGDFSSAFGYRTAARSAYETSVGPFATIYTPVSTSAFELTDRLFNIGIGTGILTDRHDGFTILKNNKTGIGFDNFQTTTEAALLQVDGTIHSTASISEIESGTLGIVPTKEWITSSDNGTSGITATGLTSGSYTITSQKWQWNRVGKQIMFSINLVGVSGTAPVGGFRVNLAGTTFPIASSFDPSSFLFTTALTQSSVAFASITSNLVDDGSGPVSMRLLLQTSIDGNNTESLTNVDFTSSSIFISGFYFID